MILSDNELTEIIGGATSISGTFINSISKLISTLLDLGRSIGSAIRYAKSKNKC